MRTYKKLLTLLLCGLLAATVASAQTLVLRHANGALTQMPLTSETSITFDDGKTVVGNRAYAASDIVSIAYKDETMPVEGDVNGDTQVNVGDIMAIINYMAGQANMGVDVADVNGDGNVNVGDVMSVINIMAGYNADGRLTDTTPTQQPPSAQAQNVGEAFYVYRNDANLNAFFREEVTSIDFSNVDADGNVYNNIVSQVVNTPDSTYIIPIAATDSVGFVTPETKYKPGVVVLKGELLDYVLSNDKLTIYFASSTPASLLPKVGDKLITMDMSDKLPTGFAGEVSSVVTTASGIALVCEPVDLLDVLERYYGTSQVAWDGERMVRQSGPARRKAEVNPTLSPGKLTLNLLDNQDISAQYQPNDNLAFALDKLQADISVTPVLRGNGFWIVDPAYVRDHGVYLKLSVIGDYDLEENFGLKGSAAWSAKKELVRLPWPILPLADVYVEFGGFVEAMGEFGIQQKWTQKYRSVFLWEYSSKGEEVLQPVNRLIPLSANHSGEVSVRGGIGAGLYLELGLDFVHTKDLDLANVNLEAKAGVAATGNIVLSKTDMESAKTSTAVYEQLRDSYVSLDWLFGLSANASILKFGVSRDIPLSWLPFDTQGTIATACMAPTFSDVKASWSKEDPTSVDAAATVSCPAAFGGRCIIVDAGLVLKDEQGNDVSRSYSIHGYNGSQGKKDMDSQFYNLTPGKKYKVYPHIKWMGADMLASPSAEFTMHFPVSLNSFKVTNAQYQNDGFSHEGQAYDYCFNVSVAATLDAEAEGIADWGYAYLDPNGNEALISLSQFGHSYTDTRYSYYRNEAHSTCTLYAYVKYAGSNAIVYGERHDYPLGEQGETSCPDGNHPHMIDLGLPSGTLWACCNVGASAPEQYGNYYAWGETSPKSDYDYDTYQYGSWYNNVVNIGSDIAGTQYDAATANWGAPWRMPSVDQTNELVKNCNSVRTTQNGVNGLEFTGPNGGTLFLPAAGSSLYGLDYFGGYYWSSTLRLSSPYLAFDLYFNAAGANGRYSEERCYGQSVRPVR